MIRTTLAAVLILGTALLGTIARSELVPEPAARTPQVWAVVVGIDRYNDPEIPRCRGAIRDSGALAQWFIATARWGNSHVLILNENGAPRHGRPEDPVGALLPTRENLDWALTGWFKHRVKPGDIAVVYFAGQGIVVEDREWLLPIDARAGNLAESGWSPEEAIDALVLKTQCKLILWLDTAPLGRDRPGAAPATDPSAGVRLINRMARWPGVTAWHLASSRPAAGGPDHGPFVSALSKGLGTRPRNLLACLDQMLQDPILQGQGFRVRGGISPLLSLWPEGLLPRKKLKPGLLLQQGHADALTAVVLSADGDTMVSASLDSTVRIWRVRDRERVLLRVLPGHMVGVTAMTLSADGRLLASGDGAGRVRVWDLAEQREKPQDVGPSPHRRRITSLAFLPFEGGSRLVSLDQIGRSMLWDTSGRLLQVKPLLTDAAIRLSGASRDGPAALALAESEGKLILIGGDGKPLATALKGMGGRPSALHLSPDGRRLAAGDEEGRARVWDVATGAVVFRHDYPEGKIGAIRFGPAGELAVGAGDRMYLAAQDRDEPGLVLEGVGDEVDSAVFSGDGRWLAALTTNGNRHLWNLADRAHPAARTLAIEGRSAGATCVAFGRDGRRLVSGEADGGIRSWDLEDGRERPRIPPHRGKVEGVAVSPDGRFLLQINRDGRALTWDLMEGRGTTTLPRRWSSGAFLPDSSQLALTRDANHGGDVVLVERVSGRVQVVFERPRARGSNEPSRVTFGRVAVARDGRQVAASTVAGQDEIACVWDVNGGPPRTFRGHTRSITSLDFSGDGRSLLTASEDGTARLWNIAPEGPGGDQPLILGDPAAGAITAASLCPSPDGPLRIVTAHWSPGKFGRVYLWEGQSGQPPRPRLLGELKGRPHAVVSTPDGRWVGTAGQDRMLHLWKLEEGSGPKLVAFEPEQQHDEQVKALAAWPGLPMIASGGDDTTVRLWLLDPKTPRGALLGTLVALPDAPEEEERWDQFADSPSNAEWVAFTPDGIYDGSLDGDRKVGFVFDHEVRPLEQYAEKFHRYQLTDLLRRGTLPPPPELTQPPGLVIDSPPPLDLRKRDTELRISLADPTLNREELRLYQNGVPVQDGRDFRPLEGRGKFAARVHLRSGTNRFYAMAGRRGDIDARSQDVEIRYDGEDTPGRIHVLALGVRNYTRNALQFADRDAIRFAEHIQRNGMEGADGPGEKIVLIDGEVTEKNVEEAFGTIRDAVKGRPEDTVVVFLAGHTDVLKDRTGRQRFSLLLPTYPFPEDAPLLAANRGVGVEVGLGNALPPGADLPFYVIYRNLIHIEALQRLIIIDACQAEAIFNDPGVRQIQQVMEMDSRRARISYLLATRRGEFANESALLEHGLLTYVLLRGMRAPGLPPLPALLPPLEEVPDADWDQDGVVTTRELRAYADRTLPILANSLPDLAGRLGPSRPPSPPESVRFQATEAASFRLVTFPRDEGKEK